MKTMIQKRIYLFIGTTAELIKLAPVIRELNRRKITFTIIASGQNDIYFHEFKWIGKVNVIRPITPKSKKSSVLAFLVWSIRTFFSFLIGMRGNFKGLNKSNSLFIVHGDTVSSLMGSLVASVYGLKLVHIESGPRSFNFLEPFPEEICRYIVSRLADIHFCPNAVYVRNLASVKGEKINTYQNTLIETFWTVMKMKSKYPFAIQRRKQKNVKYFVLVVHRQEHVLFKQKQTKSLIKFILNSAPKALVCIFLIHDISTSLVDSLDYLLPKDVTANVIKIKPLPYKDFMHLVQGAEFMVTDGGSNQQEMYYMGKPCLLLRTYSETVEGLNKNAVLSKNNKAIIQQFFQNFATYRRVPVKVTKTPSEIIVNYLCSRA